MVKKNVNFPIESNVYIELKKKAAELDTTIGGAVAHLINAHDYLTQLPHVAAAHLLAEYYYSRKDVDEPRSIISTFLGLLHEFDNDIQGERQFNTIIANIKNELDAGTKRGEW